MIRLAIVAVAVWCATARADDLDADRAFKAALQRSAGGAVGEAIELFEALGARRPTTRWTDDAWAEAARLAERSGDYPRARRALEQVVAIGTDAMLVRRARASLERLAKTTGDGRWDRVKREHERLATSILRSGSDPQQELAELEALARANPEYPQIANMWLTLAQGWEREGDGESALELLGALTPSGADRERLGFAFARIAIRRGSLGAARERLDALAAVPGADRYAIAEIRERLAIAEQRAWIRRIVWIGLVGFGLLAGLTLRRDAGSWRGAARRLARPPIEVLFLLPVGAVLVVVAQTGNPLVARALFAIVIAGLLVGWVSGALLDARRARAGRVSAPRAIGQALIATAVIAGATYLAVDRDRMLDLVSETIEHGPSH